jgi:flagellar motor protein MotB
MAVAARTLGGSQVEAFGEAVPVATSTALARRDQNRRVEV